jgi:hypothetical protein
VQWGRFQDTFFDGKQHQCCFNSLRGVNEYKGLKNEKNEKEKLNLSKRERRIAQHHLNRTTEGEEGIQGLHQDLDQSTKTVGFSFHLHLTSAAGAKPLVVWSPPVDTTQREGAALTGTS